MNRMITVEVLHEYAYTKWTLPEFPRMLAEAIGIGGHYVHDDTMFTGGTPVKTTIYVRLITTTSDKDTQETLQRAGWTGVGQWGEEMNFFWDTRIQGWPPNPGAH